MLRYFVHSSCVLETQVKFPSKNMNKKKLRITLEVMDNVSTKYTETAQYIEENIKEYEGGMWKRKIDSWKN